MLKKKTSWKWAVGRLKEGSYIARRSFTNKLSHILWKDGDCYFIEDANCLPVKWLSYKEDREALDWYVWDLAKIKEDQDE
jgi:hypothetical protein